MRSLSAFRQCTIALLCVLYVLNVAYAAPLELQASSVGNARSDGDMTAEISYRQANNDDDSYEDSSEDDGEDDAEQAQQSLIEQQIQQNLEESQEGSDEDGGDDVGIDDSRRRRRRREVEETQTVATIDTDAMDMDKDKEKQPEQMAMEAEPSPTVQPTVAAETISSPTLNRTSVLILIRDTLKKVTTVLPTEQVATNALQYFQLFEHFLQQTIERVIDDYDDDEEESTTTKVDEVNTEKVGAVSTQQANVDSKDKVMEAASEMKPETPQEATSENSAVVFPVEMTAT